MALLKIDYNKECHKLLFGNLPYDELVGYVKGVKSIPAKTTGNEAKAIFDYLNEKKKICNKYKFSIIINPKVCSSYSRVQCSINFKKKLKKFITYKSSDDKPNMLRDKEITSSIKSSRRSRGGITKKRLRELCRKNGIYKGNSRLLKNELIELLKKHDIPLE